MLKILYGYKLLHLGLAFQLPHTILLIKEITQIEYMLLIVLQGQSFIDRVPCSPKIL